MCEEDSDIVKKEPSLAQRKRDLLERLHHIQGMNRMDLTNYRAGCREARRIGHRLSELDKEKKWTKNRRKTNLKSTP